MKMTRLKFSQRKKKALKEQFLKHLKTAALGKWYWLQVEPANSEVSSLEFTVMGAIEHLGYSRMDIFYNSYLDKILMPFRPFVASYNEVIFEIFTDPKKRPQLLKLKPNLLFPIQAGNGSKYIISQDDVFLQKEDRLVILRFNLILKRYSKTESITVEPFVAAPGRKGAELVEEIKARMGAKVRQAIPVLDYTLWEILRLSAAGKNRAQITNKLGLKSVNILDEKKKKCIKTLDKFFQTRFPKLEEAAKFLQAHDVL